jgi:hypothetical protein
VDVLLPRHLARDGCRRAFQDLALDLRVRIDLDEICIVAGRQCEDIPLDVGHCSFERDVRGLMVSARHIHGRATAALVRWRRRTLVLIARDRIRQHRPHELAHDGARVQRHQRCRRADRARRECKRDNARRQRQRREPEPAPPP